MTARLLEDGDRARGEAIRLLRGGGLVALPTDTVYGLAVALAAEDGLGRLFRAKERPVERAIVLLLAGTEQADSVGEMTPAARLLAAACWPGGLTLVLRQRPTGRLPAELTGGAATIGLRVPDHDCPRTLARELGPLPVSSANRSGWPDAIDAAGVVAQLGERIDLVIDGGRARGAVPSTVIDCTATPRLLREGAIRVSRLAEVLDRARLEHALTA